MRALAWIVAVLTALWGGYWFVGSRVVKSAALNAVETLRADGNTLDYSDLSLRGFPNRFDLTLTDTVFSPVGGGFRWQAPFVQSFALSYRPNEVIVVFPPEQKLTGPMGEMVLSATDLRASAAVAASTDLPFENSVLIGKELRLSAQPGGNFTAREMRLASDRQEDRPLAHRIGLEITSLGLDPALMARIDPKGQMPKALDTVHVDAVVGLDLPLDRHLAGRSPHPTDIALTEARLIWGAVQITASGNLTVSANGVPQGRIEIRTLNWRPLLQLAIGADIVSPDAARTVEKLLKAMEKASGAANTISLPLVFAEGRMSLGPLPLGQAPRLFIP
ncbi:MAG: DUF2125 domain-containing protein [Paracoccaceae bacterium]